MNRVVEFEALLRVLSDCSAVFGEYPETPSRQSAAERREAEAKARLEEIGAYRIDRQWWLMPALPPGRCSGCAVWARGEQAGMGHCLIEGFPILTAQAYGCFRFTRAE
jgi:hypothetical protein